MTKVSIITVCRNCRNRIERTIRSVLGQDYPDIEFIVIDGDSRDGTQEVLHRYRHRVAKLLSEPDAGIYHAMNKGLCLATGEVIAFLNAGDVYAHALVVSEAAERIYKSSLDAVYGDLAYVPTRRPDKVVRYWRAGDFQPGSFRYGWVPPHPTFFCKREIYERYGSFNETYRIAGDFELMLRFIEKHRIRVGYLPKLLVYMQTGGRANQLSGMIQGNWEILRAFRVNGLSFPWALELRRPASRIQQIIQGRGVFVQPMDIIEIEPKRTISVLEPVAKARGDGGTVAAEPLR